MGKQKIWRTAAILAASAAGAWLAVRLLGPVVLPFVCGLVIALAAEPLVKLLETKLKLPRWAASSGGVAAVYGVTVLVVYVLCRVLCRELAGLGRSLPVLAENAAAAAAAVEQWLLDLAARFPDGVGAALQEGIDAFFQDGSGWAAKAYDWILDFATGVLKRVPDILLFLVTAVLSSFMLASEWPRLKALWLKKAPAAWQSRWDTMKQRLKNTLGGWVKAQVKLMLVTALVLTAGLLILGAGYPVLLGIGIAVMDALPVLGTGMVLIPWGLWSLLQGNTVLAVGLLCLYGAAALIRTALEPRMLGKQMGLSPLVTLAALYGGYQFGGILGMIFFPMAAMVAKQVWDGN